MEIDLIPLDTVGHDGSLSIEFIYDVANLPPVPAPITLPAALIAEILTMWTEEFAASKGLDKVYAVKMIREELNCGLLVAKHAMFCLYDRWCANRKVS